jgi:hypothetical protein
MKPASFSIDQSLEKLEQAIYNNKLQGQLSGATSFPGGLHTFIQTGEFNGCDNHSINPVYYR